MPAIEPHDIGGLTAPRHWQEPRGGPPPAERGDFLDAAGDGLPPNTGIGLLPLADDDRTTRVEGALLAQWQRFVDRHKPVRLCRP